MKEVLKRLIDDGVLEYSSLVLKYYHKFKLSETEAMALIKLHTLLKEQERIIKPKKFSKWLSLTPKKTEAVLDSLMDKGYLDITLTETEDGKETETFTVDYFLSKVIHHIKNDKAKKEATDISEWVAYLEDAFNKPLSQLDSELVKKWIEEDEYDFEMLKTATLKALKYNRPSIKTVDSILSKTSQNKNVVPTKNPEALKEFYKLWDE